MARIIDIEADFKNLIPSKGMFCSLRFLVSNGVMYKSPYFDCKKEDEFSQAMDTSYVDVVGDTGMNITIDNFKRKAFKSYIKKLKHAKI